MGDPRAYERDQRRRREAYRQQNQQRRQRSGGHYRGGSGGYGGQSGQYRRHRGASGGGLDELWSMFSTLLGVGLVMFAFYFNYKLRQNQRRRT